ncbi:hypothetical protein Tco_0220776, partial [Tanacetum coccineum]
MSLFKAPEGVLSHLKGLRNSFFWGADMEDRKITWISWRKVVAHKQNGGLGVVCFKYRLAFQMDMALSVVTFWSNSHGSIWIGMIKAIAKLKYKGIDLLEFCKLVIGNGNSK